ncbi:MAG: 16S rRNA (guanine(966)-N(2))-methyltransferase RsmD [Vicinamibacterales bacterium]
MRIIAGAFKGRVLQSPTWPGLRPTSDALRETLFNLLGPRLDGAVVLDLCAGTGAIGLEALSRGAARATFVDSDRRAVRLVAANADRLGVAERCMIVGASAIGALADDLGGPFDLVVIDPPYDAPWLAEVVAAAATQLAPDGVLVLEHAWRRPPPAAPRLTLVRTRRAGDSALSTYRTAADGGGTAS